VCCGVDIGYGFTGACINIAVTCGTGKGSGTGRVTGDTSAIGPVGCCGVGNLDGCTGAGRTGVVGRTGATCGTGIATDTGRVPGVSDATGPVGVCGVGNGIGDWDGCSLNGRTVVGGILGDTCETGTGRGTRRVTGVTGVIGLVGGGGGIENGSTRDGCLVADRTGLGRTTGAASVTGAGS
jgi:hypothetical protein